MGWAPQQTALYSKLSVAENLRLFAELEGIDDPRAAVERMLAQTGLDDRRDERVGRLSGGNRQRVNVAIALIADPPLLALDEPSASLDPAQRARLWGFLDAQARRGTAVMFSTHNPAEAQRYAQRLIVLADGELLFDGTPSELLAASGAAPRARWRMRCSSSSKDHSAREMAAAQGPSDPRPIAPAGGSVDRLPGGDLAADRLCHLTQPIAPGGRDRR